MMSDLAGLWLFCEGDYVAGHLGNFIMSPELVKLHTKPGYKAYAVMWVRKDIGVLYK